MTAVMTLIKTGFLTIAKDAALCCVAFFIFVAPDAQQMALAQQMTLQRVGPELAHPWGMEFLTSDSLLVTTRGGTLWKIELADDAADLGYLEGRFRCYQRTEPAGQRASAVLGSGIGM